MSFGNLKDLPYFTQREDSRLRHGGRLDLVDQLFFADGPGHFGTRYESHRRRKNGHVNTQQFTKFRVEHLDATYHHENTRVTWQDVVPVNSTPMSTRARTGQLHFQFAISGLACRKNRHREWSAVVGPGYGSIRVASMQDRVKAGRTGQGSAGTHRMLVTCSCASGQVLCCADED